MSMIASNDGLIVASLASGRLRADPTTGHVFATNWRTPQTPAGHKTAKGYIQIGLGVDGRTKNILAHRVIWIASFGAPTDSTLEINHKNGNKHDNRIENLELVSGSDNARHAKESGLVSHGSAHCCARITPAKVIEARRRAASGERRSDIAAWLGVSTRHARGIISGRKWAHVPMEDKRPHTAAVALLREVVGG